MPYKEPKIEKIYYSMKEVCDFFDVNPSTIRFWGDEFPSLKPHRNKKGNRLFTKDDLEELRLIHYLLKEKGMTLKGAQKKLKENREETSNNFEIVKRLQKIRSQVEDIRNSLDKF